MNLILGFISSNTKLLKWGAVLLALAGLGFGAKHSFYNWHTKPLIELKTKVKSLSEDLNTSRAETVLCASNKKNEVFEATSMARAESIEQIIQEAKYEESTEFNGSDADFSWMF